MIANNIALLIPSDESAISTTLVAEDHTCVFPLRRLVARKLRNMNLLDSSFNLYKLGGVRPVRVASNVRLGAPLFSYLLLLLFGLPSMTLPIVVRFELIEIRKMNFDEVRLYLSERVERNRKAYKRIPADRLAQRIRIANSFQAIIDLIGAK